MRPQEMMQSTTVLKTGTRPVCEVLGPTVEFLTSPEDANAAYSMLLGTIPPHGSVPLHSHADVESFFMLSGAVQVLTDSGGRLEWLDVRPGDFVHIPGGAKHAFRNQSNEPVVQVITTTPRLAQFFLEIGKPAVPGAAASPPTPADVERLIRLAAEYGHWLGSEEENAAIGISLPK